jgi:hypothetical protein
MLLASWREVQVTYPTEDKLSLCIRTYAAAFYIPRLQITQPMQGLKGSDVENPRYRKIIYRIPPVRS